MSSNRKLGNSFERQLAEQLAERGFWVHNFAQKKEGQPADIIAVRNRRAYLIDCKVCTQRGFNLNRIEDNQELAMTRWAEAGNGDAHFAIRVGNEVIMLDSHIALRMRQTQSALNLAALYRLGVLLEEWVRQCE